MSRPVVLCILDGWGLSDRREANAPALADTPAFDRIWAGCPRATLVTHGPDVGLPKGQMGNSEVGHMNIGAGRVVAMDLGQIDLAIEENRFASQPAFQQFRARVKAAGGRVHLFGVVSDGGVHGSLHHIHAAIDACARDGLDVVLHAITDGRDVAPQSALDFLTDDLPVGTVIGRYYAMDRDNRWDRVQTAFDAMVSGQGAAAESARGAVQAAYDAGVTDEFIPATVVGDYNGMRAQDGLFCLNFRADRAREILESIGNPAFDGFKRDRPDLAARLGMVDYSKAHTAWYDTVFPKQIVDNTLAHWVASKGLRQFHVAETEKYPHVTFFLNGGIEAPEQGEDRVMPNSPDVATYDLQPEMAADQVTGALVGAIRDGYDLIVCNFANPDMVGHTGDLGAAMAACAAVDAGLAQALEAVEQAGGAMVVTADHGNCETMVDPDTGGPHTAHTLNPVPVVVVGAKGVTGLRDGRLADLAPTVLELMGLDCPPEMTGQSLLIR